ncbi:MAG: hypothetical protein HYS20_03970 [Rhodocyclales bacterium]|nr:hypothetical protein [Rhodocyclales bacterium]
MSQDKPAQDPLDFVRGMWNNMGFSLPGMVTPTVDLDELDKRIADLKAVENWLKMNLNMLQMTTQGLEMQRVALAAVKAMSEHAAEAQAKEGSAAPDPFAAAAMWPWNFMHAQGSTPPPPEASTPEPEPPKPPPRGNAKGVAPGKK